MIRPVHLMGGLIVGLLTFAYFAVGEIRSLRTERDQAEYDLKALTATARVYRTRRDAEQSAAKARAAELQIEIAHYEKALADANRACPLNAADLDWLRADGAGAR